MKREYYYECTFREKRDYHNANIIYDNFTYGNDRYAAGICKIKPVIDLPNDTALYINPYTCFLDTKRFLLIVSFEKFRFIYIYIYSLNCY